MADLDRIQKFYIAYYGRPADPVGLNYWATTLDTVLNGNETEMVKNFGAANQPEFQSVYPNLSIAAFINSVYQNLFNRAPDTAGLNYWIGQYNLKVAQGMDPNLVRAQMVMWIVDGAQGADATSVANKLTAANAFTAAIDTVTEIAAYSDVNNTAGLQAARDWLKTVDSTAASVTAAQAQINTVTQNVVTGSQQVGGQTFTLTTGVDIITGTSGNDTITASQAELNTGDSINGGGGTDTLNVTFAAAAQPIVTLSSVENVNVTAGVASAGGAINTGNWTGVETLKLKGLGVTLADADGTTSGWNFIGMQKNVKIALENVTVGTGGHNAIRVDFASGKLGSSTATLSLDVNNVGSSGARADVAVETAGTDAFTKLAVNATGKNWIGLEKFTGTLQPTEVTVTGAGDLDIAASTNANFNNLVTVNAGSATGALTANISASNKNVTFTGSSGKNTITFGNGDNVITGGAAADTFTLGTGKNTVTGGAGNDTVIGAVADFTKDDKIDLGEGTRDALVYNNVAALDSTGVNAAALAALNSYTGIEVVGSSGAVTLIDAAYFNQTVYRLTADLTAAVTMSNVAGDTLELTGNGITGVNGDALTISGVLPNQTVTIEMNGSANQSIQATNAQATNNALAISSGISKVNIVSTTTASSTSGITNTIGIASSGTATHAVDNASAGSFVLTGNVDFNIGANAATAGFTQAVDFDASAFTGKLTIVASASADVIKGGTGNDTITGLGGNDVIDLTAGGKDTVVFEATGAANGKDTITGFGAGNGGDVLKVAAFITLPSSLTTVSSLTGAASLSDNSIVVVNMATAIAGKNYSTAADFGDLFGIGKVFSASGSSGTEVVLVIQGTDQTHIYFADIDGNNNTAWENGDITFVGVLTDVTNSASFHISNFA